MTKTTVRTLKKRPKMRRICEHGVCWKKVRTNSGKSSVALKKWLKSPGQLREWWDSLTYLVFVK